MRVLGEGWPLVGRDEELAAILDTIAAAEVTGVVVAGVEGDGPPAEVRCQGVGVVPSEVGKAEALRHQ